MKKIEAVIDACISHLGDQERSRIAAVVRGDVPEAMKFIGSSVSRMDGLINSILMLSRAGRRELNPELINMKELTNSILSSIAHQIEPSKTSVLVGELPLIIADKVAMDQIMGNLIDNALKYRVQDREGKVTITSEQGVDEVTFHVRDNGRGIAKEDLTRVFEIFRRAGKRDIPGEGMGLAYVKALVKRHGGRIWCESESGVGSVFSFTIPTAPTSKVPA
jgi:signal transduction histidine kinase